MKDTSTLFKLCVRALLEMGEEDRALIINLVRALDGSQPLTQTVVLDPNLLTNEHNPTARELLGQARFEYKKAQAVEKADRLRAKSNYAGQPKKRKSPPKKRSHAPTTNVGKVWEAMKQSSGQLGAVELAEILGLKTIQVSNALNHLYNKHPSVLKREWRKGTMDTTTMVRTPGYYLYQYKGVR